MMLRELESLIYDNIDESEYEHEEIIFLYPHDDRTIATIEVVGDELKEMILYILDMMLPIGIIFNNYEIGQDEFQIPVKYLV